jgi:hypothetical protein
VRPPGRVTPRADAGYFSGALAHAAYNAHISCAIGAKRIAPPWRLLVGIAEDDWHDATGMDDAQVAVAEYCPDWWSANTALLVRRVLLDPEQDPLTRGPGDGAPCIQTSGTAVPGTGPAAGHLRLLVHLDQPRSDCPGQGRHRGALVLAPHHGGEHLSATATSAPLRHLPPDTSRST